MPVVRISDEVYKRLQKLATPLTDSVSDVLKRVLDENEHLRADAYVEPKEEDKS